MNIKKQDIELWIKASEELPDKTAKYFVRYEQVHRGCAWFDEGDWFIWEHKQPKTKINPTHWLKPIKDVYVLTEDEIAEHTKAQEIVKELAEWSLKYPRSQIYGYGQQPKMDGELIELENKAKQFIESITKQQ